MIAQFLSLGAMALLPPYGSEKGDGPGFLEGLAANVGKGLVNGAAEELTQSAVQAKLADGVAGVVTGSASRVADAAVGSAANYAKRLNPLA